MRRILFAVIFLLTLSVTSASAQVDTIKSDFSTLEGVIIMPVSGEYLIDLDISTGIREGDILTLVKDGEKVIHPETKEILGTLDIPVGFLQVTRVKSGYSYARLIRSETTPAKGDHVKRFEQVPALIDATVPGQMVKELQANLPQFTWTDRRPIVTFSFIDQQLVMSNPDGVALRKYSFAAETPVRVAAGDPSALPDDPFSLKSQTNDNQSLLNQTVNSMLSGVGLGKSDTRLEAPGIIYNQQQNADVWTSPPFEGKPIGVTVGDFDNDKQEEIALVSDNQVKILRMTQRDIAEIARIEVSVATKIIGIDSIDLDQDKIPEIIVNAVSGTTLNAHILAYDGAGYQVTKKGLPWYLRAVVFPGLGKVLLGQKIGSPQTPFQGPVTELQWTQDSLVEGDRLKLPSDTRIFGLQSFKAPDGTKLFAAYSAKDSLYVLSPQGGELWRSGENFGGSETGFYVTETRQDELIPMIYVQPKLAVLPSGEILTAQNEGWRVLQRYRNYDKSRVMALSWDGATMREVWRTSDQNGYLADLAVADADNDGEEELVTLVQFKGGTIISGNESHLILYELKQ